MMETTDAPSMPAGGVCGSPVPAEAEECATLTDEESCVGHKPNIFSGKGPCVWTPDVVGEPTAAPSAMRMDTKAPTAMRTTEPETTEAPKDVILVDGSCPEGTEIVDSTDCEDAANELDLAWVSKYEDKSSRAGCFKMSAGLVPGVYFNAHPEAPAMDNRESYTSICRRVRETTTLPTMAPVDEPVCEKVCMADVDEVVDEVEAMKKDVDHLIEEVPEVLANTFQSVADLTKLVETLQKEVARLTELVDDHQDKFSCLAGDKKEE